MIAAICVRDTVDPRGPGGGLSMPIDVTAPHLERFDADLTAVENQLALQQQEVRRTVLSYVVRAERDRVTEKGAYQRHAIVSHRIQTPVVVDFYLASL